MNAVKRTARRRYFLKRIDVGLTKMPAVPLTKMTTKQMPMNKRAKEIVAVFLNMPRPHYIGTDTRTKVSGSMRGDSWTQENRRRRSAGLPQKRVLPFGMGTFDPISREISKILPDGTVEVSRA